MGGIWLLLEDGDRQLSCCSLGFLDLLRGLFLSSLLEELTLDDVPVAVQRKGGERSVSEVSTQ
jgi:hypothetical protein